MNTDTLQKDLVGALRAIEIIDSHEHWGPEDQAVGQPADVFSFFTVYLRNELLLAGMSEAQYQATQSRDIPLSRRWAVLEPFWEQIRWGSYARVALLAVEKFYGFSDINRDTYAPISEAMQAANRPGLYQRVIRDTCNIRTALTQSGTTDLHSPLLTPVMPLAYARDYVLETWEALSRPPFAPDAQVRSLDDYLEAVQQYMVRVKGEGCVGLKMVSNPAQEPDRAEALADFERLRSGAVPRLPKWNRMRDYIIDRAIGFATELDMVIAVHAGYWGDFRNMDPLHIIPTLQRHPNARFDVYHLGYPWVRETLMLGKGFPNVWLNFCWTHIISQRFATAALDEAMDLVPVNKLLLFGGDDILPVEKVYGSLTMALEDAAEVLARRILAGQLSESQALELGRKWLWGNPVELYHLAV
ncbi:MAG: amidohydrolase family protein [Anaerolineae bacterium]